MFKSDKSKENSDNTVTSNQQVADEPETNTENVEAPKPNDKKKKSKLCTIL